MALTRTRHRMIADGIVNVQDFGATGDGAANDAPAIQAAIDYVEPTGGTVLVPPGRYRLGAGLVFDRGGVGLRGSGWEEFTGVYGGAVPMGRGNASWLYCDDPAVRPITITNGGGNMVQIEDLGFDQSHNAIEPGWTPIAHRECIRVLAGATSFRRLFFRGCNRGIEVGNLGVGTGRTTMEHIWGEFFEVGIRVHFSADVLRLNNYHSYPFWSGANANVMDYTQANAYGIQSYRNDNAHLSNIFIGGAKVGLYLGNTADGGTNEMMVTNFDADFTNTGLMVDGDYNSASFANFGNQPGPNAALTNSRSVWVVGDGNRLRFANIRSARTNAESVRVEGGLNIVGLVNYDVNNWDDQATNSISAVHSTDNSNVISLGGTVNFGTRVTTAAPLGGQRLSYRYPHMASGVHNGTTDGSGDVTVTHNSLNGQNTIQVSNETLGSLALAVHTKGDNSFKVRAYNTTTGAAATGTAVAFAWSLSM